MIQLEYRPMSKSTSQKYRDPYFNSSINWIALRAKPKGHSVKQLFNTKHNASVDTDLIKKRLWLLPVILLWSR